MEEIIKKLGYKFRDLTYHTNKKYSCRLNIPSIGIKFKECWGDTPMQALKKAEQLWEIVELQEQLMRQRMEEWEGDNKV